MKKREISSILSRASGKDVAEIAAPLKESGRVEVLKEPQKTLVMIKVRESVGRSLFYLGELLATECMVRINGSKGFSVMAGDDFEKTFHAAVIDGYLNSDEAEDRKEELLGKIRKLDEKQKEERGRRNAQILKSKVNFNVMGES